MMVMIHPENGSEHINPTGSENSTDAAIWPPKSVPECGVENDASQIGSVYIVTFSDGTPKRLGGPQ